MTQREGNPGDGGIALFLSVGCHVVKIYIIVLDLFLSVCSVFHNNFT